MIKVITAYTKNYQHIADINQPILKNFCDYHSFGHQSYIINDSFDRPPAWAKIQYLINNLLENQYQYFMWIDIDTIIRNPLFDIFDYIIPDKYIYLSKDMNGINSGVMLLKNDPIIIDFLYEVWQSTQYVNDSCWEQAAINSLIHNNWNNIQSYIQLIPSNILNGYDISITNDPQYLANNLTFVLHFPASFIEYRYIHIRNYSEKYNYLYRSSIDSKQIAMLHSFTESYFQTKEIAKKYNDKQILSYLDIVFFRYIQNLRK